jgi:hypothetical protein
VGQLTESRVSSDGNVRERDVDIQCSKVVSLDRSGTLRKYLKCTDRMLALWDPLNWCGLIIIVVS